MEPISIAIEGVIGVGKTTLARALARHLGAVGLYEDDIENPFLPLFYKNHQRYAFTCQMAFLYGRMHQFGLDRPSGLHVVSDHSLWKEELFAQVNLAGDERSLHKAYLDTLAPGCGYHPKVVVYLVAGVDEILERIRGRGRAMEDGIDRGYLQSLVKVHDKRFTEPLAGKVRTLVVDVDGNGVANDPGAVARLAEACLQAPPGVSFCNPVA